MEGRLDHHSQHVCLHQPHRATRGPGEMAHSSAGEATAEASRDHVLHQPSLPAGEIGTHTTHVHTLHR